MRREKNVKNLTMHSNNKIKGLLVKLEMFTGCNVSNKYKKTKTKSKKKSLGQISSFFLLRGKLNTLEKSKVQEVQGWGVLNQLTLQIIFMETI